MYHPHERGLTEKYHGTYNILIAFKTRININNKQDTFFTKCVNVRRVAFNFALGTWMEMYEAHKADETKPKPSAFDIDKIFNACKKDKYPWMYDSKGKLIVPSCVGQEAIKADIKFAFNNFFTRIKNGTAPKATKKKKSKKSTPPGYPNFKVRGRDDSFKFTSSAISNKHVNGKKVELPKGYGTATLGDSLPEGKIKSTTISKRAGKWWVSFLLEVDDSEECSPNSAIGIDMGIAKFATLSDGTYYESAKALEQGTKKLTKLQRQLAKMVKGSNRYKEQKAKIAKHHKHIADTRVNHAHQISSKIAREHNVIVVEDLKLANMTKSSKGTVENPGKKVKQKSGLNRSLLNQGIGEFIRQLDYKSSKYYGKLIKVNPAYTSQTCSCCGSVSKDNRKSQAAFKCLDCGYTDNADYNAAKNILAKGLS